MLQLRRQWQYLNRNSRETIQGGRTHPEADRRGSAVITLPTQVPSSLVTDRMRRAIAVAFGSPHPQHYRLSLYDPVFLPDFTTLMPDQTQELRYAKGRKP
jgi:hypothetical protein